MCVEFIVMPRGELAVGNESTKPPEMSKISTVSEMVSVTKICVELAIVAAGKPVPPVIIISNRNSTDNPYARVADPRNEITNMVKMVL